MKKIIFLLFLFFKLSNDSKAQVHVSVYSEISIITAGPGTELYEAFGHAAIRIKDPVLNLDLIYNYGIFDFDAPNFYTNFTKGKLLYKLARYDFKYFLNSYNKDKRWVKQQVLNLTHKEKQAFFMYLERNSLPENRNYLYDPFFNNCASKLRDITTAVLGDKVTFNNKNIEENLSFRELMNIEIPWNTWGSFGINLALGNKLDNIANFTEYMYLPDYVYTIFKNSTLIINNQPDKLILREDTLLEFKELKQKILIFNPFLIFSVISIIGLFITYTDFKNNKKSKWLDFSLLFSTGIVGLVIVFLWFFTNHSTTPNNFNFLWAFAPNLIAAFFLNKAKQKWMINYFKLLLIFLFLIPILWLLKVQLYPFAAIPLLLLLSVRYLFIIKRLNS